MTPLNTIIEKEKKKFEPFLKENVERSFREYARKEHKILLTTAMQRAYEAGREAGIKLPQAPTENN